MTAPGQYDGTLQMFVEAPRMPVLARLRFLRWLAERGELEHPVAGPPAGEYARAAPPAPGPSDWPIESSSRDRADRGRVANAPASGRSDGAGYSWNTRWADPAEQW
jgi:hypothetical protein